MSNSKKLHERQLLESVRMRINGFPSGEPDPSHLEEPDFIFRDGSLTIGVELTRLVQPARLNEPSMKSQEEEQQRIVERAKNIAESKGLPPMWVTVYFASASFVGKSDRERLARHLFDLIVTNGRWQYGPVLLRAEESEDENWPEEIAAAHLALMPGTTHHWVSSSAGFINEQFADELQTEINKKDCRLTTYLNKCDVCWLIVFAEWTGPSSFYLFTEDMQKQEFVSDFKRAFFADQSTAQVWELILRSAPVL